MSDLERIATILGVGASLSDVFFNNHPDAGLIIDSSGVIIKTNVAAQSLFGSPWSIEGRNIHEFVTDAQHLELFQEFFRDPLRTSRELVDGQCVEAVRHTGELFTCVITLGHAEFERNRYAICSIRERRT